MRGEKRQRGARDDKKAKYKAFLPKHMEAQDASADGDAHISDYAVLSVCSDGRSGDGL